MADFTLIALRDEIEADPLALGYKNSPASGDWKGDSEIADLINNTNGTTPRTVNRVKVDTGDIRSDLAFEAYDGLTAAENAWLDWLTANGTIKVNAHMLEKLGGIGGTSIWAVADRPTAEAAMLALMQYQGGRAEELWGEGTKVSASQVGQAFNLIGQ